MLLLSIKMSFVLAVPKFQFREAEYKVDEADGALKAMVYRSGDINQRSTVCCYTRQGSAQVMMDYEERPNTDASIIVFLPGLTTQPVPLLILLFIQGLLIYPLCINLNIYR